MIQILMNEAQQCAQCNWLYEVQQIIIYHGIKILLYINSMKNTAIAIICLLVTVTTTQGLSPLAFNTMTTLKQGIWIHMGLVVEGGSGDYHWQFLYLEKNWHHNDNRIFVLQNNIQSGKYYLVKFQVLDRQTKESFNRSVILTFGDQNLKNYWLADVDERLETQGQRQQFVSQYDNKEESLMKSQQQTPTASASGQIANGKYPTSQEISQMLEDGQWKMIKSLIDKAMSSQTDCKQASRFVNQVLTKTNQRISTYQSSSENARQQYLDLQKEIEELQAQINNNNQAFVNVNQMNNRLQSLLAQIRMKQSQQQQLLNRMKLSEQEMRKYEYELSNATNHNYATQYQSAQHKMSQISNEMSTLQLKMNALKQQHSLAQSASDNAYEMMQSHEANASKYNQMISNIKQEMSQQQATNQSLSMSLSILNDESNHLEDQVNKADAMNDRKRSGMFMLQNQLAQKQQAMEVKHRVLQRVQSLMSDLQLIQSSEQQRINNYVSYCYYKNPRTQNGNSQLTNNALMKYLKRTFNAVPDSNLIATLSGRGMMTINRQSIFSPDWVKIYGVPYTAGYGSNMEYNENRFSCETVQGSDSFSGRIMGINKNKISVMDQRNRLYTLEMGPCTQIETVVDNAVTNSEQKLPSVGDTIFWRTQPQAFGSQSAVPSQVTVL